MWLLNTSALELKYFFENNSPTYAVLSHRWTQEEVTFEAMGNGDWQQVCYVFLNDVMPPHVDDLLYQLADSNWFRTLQELIAPRSVEFFDCEWNAIGTKISLAESIAATTRIDVDVLTGRKHAHEVSVWERFSWVTHRSTTRLEDRTYCLLGQFAVNMPLLYGEGDRAWDRLIKQIAKLPPAMQSFSMVKECRVFFHVHFDLPPDMQISTASVRPGYAWSIKGHTALVEATYTVVLPIASRNASGDKQNIDCAFGVTKRTVGTDSSGWLQLGMDSYGHDEMWLKQVERLGCAKTGILELELDLDRPRSLTATIEEQEEMARSGARVFVLVIRLHDRGQSPGGWTLLPEPSPPCTRSGGSDRVRTPSRLGIKAWFHQDQMQKIRGRRR
ncbi:hypothetical protein LTR78_008867 [Recurvomyces mirabilis]|uniref:Uncharacterized protein n=1 Tax=Recurvomyces mirabilis TaxID=574656 RepID=A0AAE0TSN1_9PEZI|nr:hypothetical protein LTR78_008867 [Recurvomyces mirabilis]KAK5155782.1 hypothetical protein LTS14_005348 [Recurvomyces mirabilis]